MMRSSGETSSPRPVCVRRKRSSSAIPGEVTRKCGEPFMRSLHDGVRFWLLGIFGMLGIFGLSAGWHVISDDLHGRSVECAA